MLSIILDIGGGYLVARYVRNIWFSLLAATAAGIGSAVGANMLIYAMESDVFTPSEIALRITSGLIIHPVVTIIVMLIYRRKIKRNSNAVQSSQGEGL